MLKLVAVENVHLEAVSKAVRAAARASSLGNVKWCRGNTTSDFNVSEKVKAGKGKKVIQ